MMINWVGSSDKYTGYGRMNAYFVRELCALGVDVAPTQFDVSVHGDLVNVEMPDFDHANLTISLTQPQLYPTGLSRQWAFTMYEDTSIPDGWADILNTECERLIVLCEHNAKTFKQAGVCVPIHVVHGGTDPNEFPLIEKRPERPYTFLCLGDRGMRKGTMETWMAFFEAFDASNRDVRLIIKTREDGMKGIDTASFSDWDDRISVWKEDVEDVADIYREADCFVFPSYGEGWGMPPREAAMMGLPVIATDWAGLSVGIDNWALPIRDYAMLDSHLKTKDGKWTVPNYHDVAEKMRWCYENQGEAHLKGLNARLWLMQQTWTHSAQKIKALIEEYG